MPAAPAPSYSSPRLGWLRRLAPVALVLAALLTWANSFSGPFVFDDRPAILANPTLESFSSALSPPRDGGTVAGRPLVNLSFAFNRALSGSDVWSYHAVNLLIHVLAGLTLFGVVRRTVLRTSHAPAALPITFGAALVWIVHPLQTASVTYVVQRAESLMGLCFLLTLYAFIRRIDASQPPEGNGQPRVARLWTGISIVACAAGMGCKEVMAVAPLVVLLYDGAFVAGTVPRAMRVRPWFYVALASTWLLLATAVVANAGRAGTVGFSSGVTPVEYALTQCAAVVRYLGLAVWPAGLTFDYGTAVTREFGAVWPQAIVVILLIAAALVTWRRNARAGFLGMVFFAILAPSSSFVPVLTQTIAEHRMYLPLAAVAVAVALGLQRVLPSAFVPVMLAIALALGWVTHRRNLDYRSGLALWRDTVAQRPDNARAHNHLGIELARAGERADAARHFETALRLTPNDAEAHNNLGNVLIELGRPAEALAHFEASVQLRPDSAAARLSLARALLGEGRAGDALPHFEAAAKQNPLNAASHADYGLALAHEGRLAEAIRQYREALALDASQAKTHYNLGLAHARLRQYAEAIPALATAIRLDPQSVAARVNLANSLFLAGRPAEAVPHYEAALRLEPNNAQIQRNLTQARSATR